MTGSKQLAFIVPLALYIYYIQDIIAIVLPRMWPFKRKGLFLFLTHLCKLLFVTFVSLLSKFPCCELQLIKQAICGYAGCTSYSPHTCRMSSCVNCGADYKLMLFGFLNFEWAAIHSIYHHSIILSSFFSL